MGKVSGPYTIRPMHTCWSRYQQGKSSFSGGPWNTSLYTEVFTTDYLKVLIPTNSYAYYFFLSSVGCSLTSSKIEGVVFTAFYYYYNSSFLSHPYGYYPIKTTSLTSSDSSESGTTASMRPFVIIPHSSYTLTTDETGQYDYLITPNNN